VDVADLALEDPPVDQLPAQLVEGVPGVGLGGAEAPVEGRKSASNRGVNLPERDGMAGLQAGRPDLHDHKCSQTTEKIL
jgi:hypothetical protein